ncbi:hypothetical protein WMO40_17230, partial [Bacillaceae bacterium CLA-AA-H227]
HLLAQMSANSGSKFRTAGSIYPQYSGGVIIFGLLWLFLFSSNQSQNQYNARVKGTTGQEAGGVKLFRFRFSPISLGLVLFMVLSLCLTIVYYKDYFF